MINKSLKRKALIFTLVVFMILNFFTPLADAGNLQSIAGNISIDNEISKRETPLMGWASWNKFQTNISEDIIKSQIDALDKLGLKDLGYTYVNIDDGFQNGRGEDGFVKANPAKFPNGMKAIADYAHSKGMKAGIYSDAGRLTCGYLANGQTENDDVGLYGYDEQDLKMYLVDWDFDFIKVDWCGGNSLGLNQQERYTAIGNIINQIETETGKDKIYNVCSWGFPGEWVVNVADSWRTGGDISPNFDSILYQVDQIKSLAEYAGPSHVNDLDMLQVGNGMTYEEDKSHFSMWAMMSTPLMLGMDLANISNETLSIVKNKEMIDINQDAACLQATVAKTLPGGEIWEKPLGSANSNTKAVALLNRTNAPLEMTVHWNEIGLSGPVTARDLWVHQDLIVGDNYTVTLPPHGISVLKVTGETANNTTVIQSNVKSAPEIVNLTENGNIDWVQLGENEKKSIENVISDYTVSGNPAVTVYDNSDSTYSWKDGTNTAQNNQSKKGLRLSGSDISFEIKMPSVRYRQNAKLYLGSSSGNIKVTAILDGKQTEESIDTASGKSYIYTVDYHSAEASRLTLKVSLKGSGNMSLEAVTAGSFLNGKGTASLAEKPAALNLTAVGKTDWAYYGQYQNKSGIYKADGERVITLKTKPAAEPASNFYDNAVTSYSWEDGDTVKTCAGVTSGFGREKVGAYAEITVPSDSTEKTLTVAVGGYSADIKVEATVAGKLVFEEVLSSAEYTKTDRLLTLTYSSAQPSTASVKWTVIKRAADGYPGSISIEAAALASSSDKSDKRDFFDTSVSDINGDINLDDEKYSDWISFGGKNGNISKQKSDILSDYVTLENAEISSNNIGISFTGGGNIYQSGASQSRGKSHFEFNLPGSDKMQSVSIYFTAGNAAIKIQTILNDTIENQTLYVNDSEKDSCFRIAYRSTAAVKVVFVLESAFSDKSLLCMDAVTLNDQIKNYTSQPEIIRTDNTLTVKSDMVYEDGGYDKVNFIAAVYDTENILQQTSAVSVSLDQSLTESSNTITIPDKLKGSVKVFTWNSDLSLNNPVDQSYTVDIPDETIDHPDLSLKIGTITAKDLVAKGAVLLDVRTKTEFDMKHIEGSVNIPHTEIISAAENIIPNKDTPIITYCGSAKRSTQAQQMLQYLGYREVYNLGSMDNWYIEPTVTISYHADNYVKPGDPVTINYNINVYDTVEVKYSVGKDSTIHDALPYTNLKIPITPESSITIKAYLVYNNKVYAQNEQIFDVYQSGEIPRIVPDIYASDMEWISATIGWGQIGRDKSVDSNILTVGGRTFQKGIGTHTQSQIKFAIPQNATRFITVAGCDDEVIKSLPSGEERKTQYFVYIDGIFVEKSLVLNVGMYHVFDISIPTDSKTITLVADQASDGNGSDHSDWGIAGFVTK